MKIGNARVCLTPKEPFYLIGYRSENRFSPATGIHDDIYANALLFEQEGRQVFIFSADFLEFEEAMAEDVKTLLYERFQIERDLVLLSATHNHSSIVAYHKQWYTGKFDQAYYDWLLDVIVTSFETCQNNKREASALYGKKEILGYYGNRNHPGVPADNEVSVIKFCDENKQPFAGIVNWAVHSTIIGANNTELTSEFAGIVSKNLEASFGFYPAMIVGAAGDCSNRNERLGNDFKELQRVSTALAEEIALIDTTEVIELSSIQYCNILHSIHHNMAFVHEELKLEFAKLEVKLQEASEEEKKELIKRSNSLRKKMDINEFHLDAKGEVISLGGLQLFVFPGELGSAFGKKMKQGSNVPALICGYTNGYYEYFMPQEEYGLSFETIGSPIPKGEPEKMIAKYIQASKQF